MSGSEALLEHRRAVKLDDKKFCFIICCNDEEYQSECEYYIRQLCVPDTYTVEVIPVRGAKSMAAGYNQAMRQSDARYKIYLHQDVFIFHRSFLQDMLAVFEQDPKVGILGVVGSKRLPENGCMWSNRMRVGAVRSRVLSVSDDFFDIPMSPRRLYTPVEALDGLLLMTQYDIRWREELFTGWDFYDVSQCMEFARHGYRAAVVYQEEPWVLHDNGFLHMGEYHRYRKVFLEEYFAERKQQIAECDGRQQRQQEWMAQREAEAASVREDAWQLMKSLRYDEAFELMREHLEENQEDEQYCILFIFLQIYQQQRQEAVVPHVFSYLEENHLPPEWLYGHFRRILHCRWRREYHLPKSLCQEGDEYLQMTGAVEVAERYGI